MSRLPSLAALCLGAASLAGCATRSCDNPYVLDHVAQIDRDADLSSLGLLRDPVRTTPTADPAVLQCAVWQRLRNPAYGSAPNQPATLLQPQHFQIRQVENGWRLVMLP